MPETVLSVTVNHEEGADSQLIRNLVEEILAGAPIKWSIDDVTVEEED